MSLDPEGVRRMRGCFGDAVAITLTDPAAEAAGERLLGLADERGWREVCLDLGGVPHLSSGGLVTLLALNKRVRNRGGHLRLVNVADPVYEVFRLTHLHTILDVRPEQAGTGDRGWSTARLGKGQWAPGSLGPTGRSVTAGVPGPLRDVEPLDTATLEVAPCAHSQATRRRFPGTRT
jgi:anti-sigma B factor antagonist